jgi:hypothetical protein
MVPSVHAPSRQFVKPPAKFEPTAMAAYYAIASSMPCAMASKHNFLGTILPLLSSVASKVLPFLAPMAGSALTALGQKIGGQSAPAAKPTQARLEDAPPAPSVRRAQSVTSRSSVRSRAKTRSKRRVRLARVR